MWYYRRLRLRHIRLDNSDTSLHSAIFLSEIPDHPFCLRIIFRSPNCVLTRGKGSRPCYPAPWNKWQHKITTAISFINCLYRGEAYIFYILCGNRPMSSTFIACEILCDVFLHANKNMDAPITICKNEHSVALSSIKPNYSKSTYLCRTCMLDSA